MDNMNRDDLFGNYGNDDWWKGKWFKDYLNTKTMTEEELVDIANRNTYALVTGQKTMEEIFDAPGEHPFVSMPGEKVNNKDIEGMMDYFIGTEEYEKCAVLRDILSKDSGEFPRGDDRSHRVEDHLM